MSHIYQPRDTNSAANPVSAPPSSHRIQTFVPHSSFSHTSTNLQSLCSTHFRIITKLSQLETKSSQPHVYFSEFLTVLNQNGGLFAVFVLYVDVDVLNELFDAHDVGRPVIAFLETRGHTEWTNICKTLAKAICSVVI
jgi:hypothetical protein